MAEFYLESEFLDLKKVYQNYNYEGIVEEVKINIEGENEQIKKQQQMNDSINKCSFKIVEEKDIVFKDVMILCRYFHCEIKGDNSTSFAKGFNPKYVKDKICHIIQIYQEQAVLLDSLMERIVIPIMSLIKVYLIQRMDKFIEEKKEDEISVNFHLLLSIIYLLCKVE